MPLIVIGVILVAAVSAVVYGGIAVVHVMHAYPVQFWFGAVTFMIFAFGAAAGRFRAANRRVPLRPPAPVVPPLPKALQAAPVLTAIASEAHEDALDCENPECPNKVDDDPWRARLLGEREYVFCSEACAHAWHDARRPGVRS